MNIKSKILQSIELVVQQSVFVKINHVNISLLAKKLLKMSLPTWDNELQFVGTDEQTIQYYFFIDSINFCFWAEKGKEKWQYQKEGTWISGYYAFSYAIKRAVEQNLHLLDANYLATIPFAEFKKIFSAKNELLLLKERHKIIQENFSILKRHFQGEASRILENAKGDVNKIVGLLLEHFPSFKDTAIYKGNEVFFLKRAQIFPSDVSFALHPKGLGYIKNLDDLAIFADYKLPQLLESEMVLEYGDELKQKITNEELILPGSEEEIEIRANTIYACELLREEMKRLGKEMTSNELDWILWVWAKQTTFTTPHHKTVSIYY